MSKTKKKKEVETLEDKLKYEIAKELGLLEKIKKVGWAGLTAKETGRIGGMITVKKKLMKCKLEKQKEL
ncbi:small, acid-soluble spore protein, alpha/beta type [Caloranaerobacter sp. DY30410]|uniref:small, acid-soluble spore protein, alpha/beta type n=1 Tax=Caloranaerobacter sp. DY30410 TaxID=3238305 RepID=UPI003D00B311